MKKITLILFVFCIGLFFFSSCKSTKGCGLTSDTQKIEQATETIVLTDVVAD